MINEFIKGIWKENPVFVLLLGLCPTLGVTNTLFGGLGMGLATTFVLVCSSLVISLLKGVIPPKVRIPSYIVVIATFVTLVDMLMEAYLFDLHKLLGIFIPLIVVNCVILGRAEGFASKNGLLASFWDGLGMGAGFTLALSMLGAVREFFGAWSLTLWKTGSGSIGFALPETIPGIGVFVQPPGAFLALGLLTGLFAALKQRSAS